MPIDAEDESMRDKPWMPMLMDKGNVNSLFTRNLPASRRYLLLLLGVILVCIFTVIKLLTCESIKSENLPEAAEWNISDTYRKSRTEQLPPPINLTDSVRVLCYIQTTPNTAESKALHIKRTWGRRCNKLLLMSSQVNEKVGTIGLNAGEGRNNLANKTFEAFQYIYEHHLNEYDWFMKADDDAYVIMENLRYFLHSYSPEFPIFFGSKLRMVKDVKQGYFSGGPGYILSREALRRFAEVAVKSPDHCSSKGAHEDVEIGKCMEFVNVTAGDSRDCDERARIFPEPPEFFFNVDPAKRQHNWFNIYSYYQPYYGEKCCSDLAISFHYIKPSQMYAMDYLLYELHPYGVEYRKRDLLPKKSWEEARIVAPGPYTAKKPTPKPTPKPKPTSKPPAEKHSLPNDVLDMAKMLVSNVSIKDAKMDYLVDRLLANKALKDKLSKKLKK